MFCIWSGVIFTKVTKEQIIRTRQRERAASILTNKYLVRSCADVRRRLRQTYQASANRTRLVSRSMREAVRRGFARRENYPKGMVTNGVRISSHITRKAFGHRGYTRAS